jgi:tetratricopeptide (TPR) repeat protein
MNERNQLFEEFYEIDVNDHIRFVEFYEVNRVYFENKKTFADKDELLSYTQAITKFIIGLENIGRYKQTIQYSDKYSPFLKEQAGNHDKQLKDFTYYWSIQTSKGRAAFNLKDYKTAIEVFSELKTWDSENDYFINWLRASKHGKRNIYNKALYIAALVFIILSVLIDDRSLSTIFLIPGLLLILVASVNDYIGNKAIRWSKN